MKDLAARIEREYENTSSRAREVFDEFVRLLNQGSIRAAAREGSRWVVNTWVKKGILLGFKIGRIQNIGASSPFQFFDKDTYPTRDLRLPALEKNIRVVPGGSSVRNGVYLGSNVTIMPPAYVNVAAYVDDNTMIDSHALVGSCAQIGKNVHISAAAQIGGVIEPIGAVPVIIEDDVLVGGNCGVYEGTLVRQGAVLAAGTILTSGTPVYDLVRRRVYRKQGDQPLEIPENAVVVPGSRALSENDEFSSGLSLYAPIIVKYRDQKTDAATQLEKDVR
ncbi:MAG: 2,3,4,5-tetrahydropyridine-2,6-dicarboxylate N-succinyltransferase [Acidobacteria bacterium]|nr:2,3,4,5-tetrahydropyridine-2,6-dicarboxylate N-succinyltransferase [Acidobacteriota bacterium]